ncbi:heme-binding protein [Telmatospirillum sp. J64-1]|uniref:GlcG/HbpS family heme-binding protein n=1 Tax=Telmatospirillum sp. J64-1 TaxID=2502183 RepID=UPI00115D2A4E|nr:heme-binding protein [Telmatospirillum sp. J64-1]
MKTREFKKLTHEGAFVALSAAVDYATEIGVPQNICIVDDGGNLLAFIRMDGAKFLSSETCMKKAITAASHSRPSGSLLPELEVKLSLATNGRLTNLEGGFPIIIDGYTVGGIGVGSGSGSEDVAVAKAALRALGAEIPGEAA